jgi:RNA polymerase sigma-70 factor, ECF subfamily
MQAQSMIAVRNVNEESRDPECPDAHELVGRAARGDEDAFEILIRRYQQLVHGTVLRLLQDREDARDAAQEVFLKLHRQLSRLKPDRSVGAWLYRVSVNAARDLARKRRRREIHVGLDFAAELPSSAWREDPDRQMASSESGRLLQAAMTTLPEMERFAVLLRDVEGLDTDEIAGVLGVTAGTVRSHLSLGRLRLRKQIERMRATGRGADGVAQSRAPKAWWRRRT